MSQENVEIARRLIAEASTEAYVVVVVGEGNKTEWAKVFPDFDQALKAASERAGDIR